MNVVNGVHVNSAQDTRGTVVTIKAKELFDI